MKATLTAEISLSERVNRINQLDLEPIILKLIDEDEGEDWTIEQAFAAEKLYKQFLILSVKHPNASIVPNKIMDAFWHYHILDTKKYFEDCEYTFGYFLHHFPYFGMRGETDSRNLQDAFLITKELFRSEFGKSIEDASAAFNSFESSASKCDGSGTGTNDCGSCGSGATCTSGKCTPGTKPYNYNFQIRPILTTEQRILKMTFE
jgi:hypothetical protein